MRLEIQDSVTKSITFLRSHVVIRTVENIINSGSNCGIQILVEYKDVQQSGEKTGRQKIDLRASLATDEQHELFDRLKDFAEELFTSRNYECP